MLVEHTGWHLQADKLAEGRLNLSHTAHTSRRPSCAVLEGGDPDYLRILKIYSEEVLSLEFIPKFILSAIVETESSHSHASNAFSKRNASYWTVRVLALADFGCRWLSQLWRVTDPRPDLENFCGHDTVGILGADR